MNWFNNLDIKLQVIIISSLTSILIFFLGWIIRIIYERTSLNYKLRKEYHFEQKKKLKEEIAKNKMHLLNAGEELNHRLWNFSQNVGENWHSKTKEEIFNSEQYYIKSFVYRFLKFLHWVIETEKDTISFDTIVANKKDILFLKYVKTFKDIFTDADLLKDLGYNKTHNTNHFFKNDLKTYTKLVTINGEVIDFDEFKETLLVEYDTLEKVVEYFSKIENLNSDKNLNILRACHLIIIKFLNTFGHDYQKTNSEKINKITEKYKTELLIKKELKIFIKKSKLNREFYWLLCKIK
jgi:hypothetical protein